MLDEDVDFDQSVEAFENATLDLVIGVTNAYFDSSRPLVPAQTAQNHLDLTMAGLQGGGPGGTPGTGSGSMSATINGQPWNADGSISNALLNQGNTSLTVFGLNPSAGLSEFTIGLTVTEMTGPGTYQLAGPDLLLSSFAVVAIPAGDRRWDTLNGDGGTVVITSVIQDRIAGTFSFTAGPQALSNADGIVTVTDGQFDLPLTRL